MNEILKWLIKLSVSGVFWVFCLSVTVEGRTVFSYAHNYLINNTFVEMLDGELADLWSKVYKTARTTFSENQEIEKKL